MATAAGALLVATLALFYFSLPRKLFDVQYSTVIYASDNTLLGAMIAADGQWRFPGDTTIPRNVASAITCFEDNYFYWHPGVDALALARAAWSNVRERRIVSGGSTITMQVARLSLGATRRSPWQKLLGMWLALRLEASYSKAEILALWASHAPFGGNVIGLRAAAWRYFGKSSSELSWAEAATLAVLPNAPSLVFPGKNRDLLRRKRDLVLKKLRARGIIDAETLRLSVQEPVPGKPYPLPRHAPHLLARVSATCQAQQVVTTTLDANLQRVLNEIVGKHVQRLEAREVYNIAAIVADVETGNVLAYVGNTRGARHQNDVDVIVSPRSTGSILKPFLYAAALDCGQMLPSSLLPDVPVMFAGYSPRNFSNSFDGAVNAGNALARSLNIPFVCVLKEYGYERFHDYLKRCGLTTLDQPASRYGLSLILGGAEGSLWDIAGAYASMARGLKHFGLYNARYDSHDIHPLTYIAREGRPPAALSTRGLTGAGALWFMFNALLEVNRPEEETGWEDFMSSKKVAWKTGTSFGFRDGWAVGINSTYVAAVWTGNASGTGRPGLTGVECAAPVLFDIFRQLPGNHWFDMPYDDLRRVAVCKLSGNKATELCTGVDTVWIPRNGLQARPCRNHILVHVDKSGDRRVTDACVPVPQMKHLPWFVLPPLQEWYFKKKNPSYKPLPPFMAGCGEQASRVMDFIYPQPGSRIYVPVELSNKKGQAVLEVAHVRPSAIVHWHLDEMYLGYTRDIHQVGISPSPGKHLVTVCDEDGNIISREFEVVSE